MVIKKIGNVRIENNKVIISDKYLDECIDIINQNKFSGVLINDLYYKYKDINFLEKCLNIECLSINHNYIGDLTTLYSLKNLKELSLGQNDANPKLNLTEFQSLDCLYFHWSPGIKGLEHLKNLKELGIWNYAPKSKDFEELGILKNLEDLMLTQPRIISFNGISQLTNLKRLEINYARNLIDINELVGIAKNLTRFELEACKKVNNFQPIEKLFSLEYLALNNCGDLKSVNFIKNLKNLQEFVFWETTILDGDLYPLKNVAKVHFNNKKHYSHKLTDFK